MNWTGWYPWLFSTSGLLGHTYLNGAEVAHNLTLALLIVVVIAGWLIAIHSTSEM